MKKILKILVINVLLFAILEPLSVLIAFLSGYAASDQERSAWKLYVAVLVFQLIINLLLLKRINSLSVFFIVWSSMEILILYGLVAVILK